MTTKYIKQDKIIEKMKNGWQFYVYSGMSVSAHLMKTGEKSIHIHSNTYFSMRDKGVIKSTGYSFPREEYMLSE